MATQYTANIKLDRVINMGIWINSKKATLSSVYNQLQSKYPGKEIYISNCGFFSMTDFIPCFGLKADGKDYASCWAYGFLAFEDNKIKFGAAGLQPNAWRNGITGYPVLIENGKKSPAFSHCVDNSNRGRTMMGYTNDSVVLSVISDVSGSSDFTLDEELNYMLNLGCKYAINLDGGGSSQCNFNGNKIVSSRKVHNFVYIVAEPSKSSSTTKPIDSPISSTYSVGSVIKLKNGAKYTTGKSIPSWVLKSTLYCRAINSNGTITFSTLKTGAITGTVSCSYIEGTASDPQVNAGYNVKVNCGILNIRNGAGTTYSVVGTAVRNETLTITETKNGWGKCKNGWVCLTYTEKI